MFQAVSDFGRGGKIGRRVDVMPGHRIGHRYLDHFTRVFGQNGSGAHITVQSAKFVNVAARKPNGMATPPTCDRNGNRCTGTQGLGHLHGIRWHNQRHICQGDEPAICLRTPANAKGQAGAHTPMRVGAHTDLGTR